MEGVSKRDVMNALIKEGFSKDVAQWVVTNLQQTSSPGSSSPSFSWVFDLKGIAEMYQSYEETNLWYSYGGTWQIGVACADMESVNHLLSPCPDAWAFGTGGKSGVVFPSSYRGMKLLTADYKIVLRSLHALDRGRGLAFRPWYRCSCLDNKDEGSGTSCQVWVMMMWSRFGVWVGEVKKSFSKVDGDGSDPECAVIGRNIVEDVPRGVHVNFLKAERSLHRWALEDLQRIHAAEDLAADEGGGVEMHVLEDAGHWVCGSHLLQFLQLSSEPPSIHFTVSSENVSNGNSVPCFWCWLRCTLITQMASSGFSPLPSKESKPNELPNFHSGSVSAFLKF
ncbi:hypothetical protein CK203_081090 [Vitis vinifera]|uniref:Uncharacterized protein n=1 Tax=Vitis vinifera TaxID=29760 RepID=A0A438DCK5_VITVI|nr:hypothetical protein CK203_081090 [Vitis vinifera]